MRTTMKATSYESALGFLIEAADALDQAHASMRDAQVDDVESCRGAYSLSVRQLAHHTDLLLNAVIRAKCEECDHLLPEHGADGCCGPGRDPDRAPCGCPWGSEKGGRL